MMLPYKYYIYSNQCCCLLLKWCIYTIFILTKLFWYHYKFPNNKEFLLYRLLISCFCFECNLNLYLSLFWKAHHFVQKYHRPNATTPWQDTSLCNHMTKCVCADTSLQPQWMKTPHTTSQYKGMKPHSR